ncbi:hypothetical protein SAMD00023378_3876 [Ralstonia sp. NT80]|uniref:hypothetical protein n=1 Tax=Ralstonia sp. NT80 TaxID=1218247 RepID=UPI00066BD7AB|nr:hypothetical protein [Ralstonia sp. NT80]GAQ30193.1 hypothetical protein SAMD00023378_3876 [Ralstonia sp. NT80]
MSEKLSLECSKGPDVTIDVPDDWTSITLVIKRTTGLEEITVTKMPGGGASISGQQWAGGGAGMRGIFSGAGGGTSY